MTFVAPGFQERSQEYALGTMAAEVRNEAGRIVIEAMPAEWDGDFKLMHAAEALVRERYEAGQLIFREEVVAELRAGTGEA